MKIAIVENLPVAGGIIRYGTNLAYSLKKKYPKCEISYFTNERNHFYNANLYHQLENSGIQIIIIESTKSPFLSHNIADQIYYKIFKTNRQKRISNEIISKTKHFDSVLFTVAHASDFIETIPKSFAVFHDLNFNYLFGLPLFSKESRLKINSEIVKWSQKSKIIVSSMFIKKEVNQLLPDYKKDISVVYLPQLLSIISEKVIEDKDILSIKAKYSLPDKYILYPASLYPHKNHNVLFSAFFEFYKKTTKDGSMPKLVLSGFNTDYFKYAIATELGLKEGNPNDFNVLGLGYVENTDIDTITENAMLVISPSLYEAGSGPALDAWSKGVPVILSDIGSHRDQMNFFKIDCPIFHPMNVANLADVLFQSYINIDSLKLESKKAKKALEDYDWDQVASQYYNILSES